MVQLQLFYQGDDLKSALLTTTSNVDALYYQRDLEDSPYVEEDRCSSFGDEWKRCI